MKVLKNRGFTIIEILMTVTIIAILLTLVIVNYANMKRKSVDALVMHTASDAQKALQTYGTFNGRTYPSNIAGTEYAPPLEVAVALYTNAEQTPFYENLNEDQNAQLFLNSCNGYMPVVDGDTTYNNSCVYNGDNAHIKGTISSNVVVRGPEITQSNFVLTCGAACDEAQSKIISAFLQEGGKFPVNVPKKGSTLPTPVMRTTGVASKYCLEARSPKYPDIVYYATQDAPNPSFGACPTELNLHYP